MFVGYLTEVQFLGYDFFYCFIFITNIIQLFNLLPYIFAYYYFYFFKRYKKCRERFELLSIIIIQIRHRAINTIVKNDFSIYKIFINLHKKDELQKGFPPMVAGKKVPLLFNLY